MPVNFSVEKIYLVPGPVQVAVPISELYRQFSGSPHLDPEFLNLYVDTERLWRNILATRSSIVFMTGEAMLGLWAGLKSCLRAGDKVLAVVNGIFGDGIASMAESLGAVVQRVEFPYDLPAADFTRIAEAVKQFRPKMITAVHCETPSGMLNPLEQIGAIKAQYQVPLLYVDAVASIGGAPVAVDAWHIDICLGGSQKAPSGLADMTFVAVSEVAWEIIQQIGYQGYDALLPFQNVAQHAQFPYTPHWQGVAALHKAAELLLQEGLTEVYQRHAMVAKYCQEQIQALGLDLYPQDIAYAAPTVTAIRVPATTTWKILDRALRVRGMLVGGSYGELAGKVFRIGHMGTQANFSLLQRALTILRECILEILEANEYE